MHVLSMKHCFALLCVFFSAVVVPTMAQSSENANTIQITYFKSNKINGCRSLPLTSLCWTQSIQAACRHVSSLESLLQSTRFALQNMHCVSPQISSAVVAVTSITFLFSGFLITSSITCISSSSSSMLILLNFPTADALSC